MAGSNEELQARHVEVLREMREVAGKDGGILGQFAEKWAKELEAAAPPNAGEAVACETCGGTGWVEFEGYGNSHHRKCPHCKHPAPPSAGEAEWPLFTWSGIAPRKLDALRSQGWSVNGYALYRDGMRGLIDLHGAVHWVGESPTPPIAALAEGREAVYQIRPKGQTGWLDVSPLVYSTNKGSQRHDMRILYIHPAPQGVDKPQEEE